MDIMNSLHEAKTQSSRTTNKVAHIINGWRTITPLLEAAVRLNADSLKEAIEYQLEQTKKLSLAVFSALNITDQKEEEYVRAVILEFIKKAYENEYDDILEPEVFVETVSKLIQEVSISAEFGEEYHTPIFLAQAKLASKIATSLIRENSDDGLQTKIRVQTKQVIKLIKKSSQKFTMLHVNEQELEQLHYLLIEDAGDLYTTIYQEEQKAHFSAIRTGQEVADIDIEDITLRRFNLALTALVDALIMAGDAKL